MIPAMTFGEALEALKEGKKVYRVGDKVRIKVTNTNIPAGEVDFTIV